MTTEATQPQSELGAAPATGQGQSQGHRRRRRRRKNKTSQASAPRPSGATGTASGSAAARQQPQAPAPRHRRPARTRTTRPAPGPKEEEVLPEGCGSRPRSLATAFLRPPRASGSKGKQKGPREFVGPMDHSYRVANGNVADGPPSTIQITNGHAATTRTTSCRGRRPVREDAPTRIFCFIEDLFFLAKIQETARKLGVKVAFVKGDKESVAKLRICPRPNGPRWWFST